MSKNSKETIKYDTADPRMVPEGSNTVMYIILLKYTLGMLFVYSILAASITLSCDVC